MGPNVSPSSLVTVTDPLGVPAPGAVGVTVTVSTVESPYEGAVRLE